MTIFLKANWENIIMANYEIDPKILFPFLPKGVELDLYDGKAYVSLVGFMFKKTKLFNVPIPYFGTFEEINLRFYVVRKEGDTVKRGVVFINETIPYPIVAWMANKLYKEHYTVVPTKHEITTERKSKKVQFEWLLSKKWNSIYVEATTEAKVMEKQTLEKFIYEHYYGYTKIDEHNSEEYKLQHPSWLVNQVLDYKIECDFTAMYGDSFSVLNTTKPEAVFIAEGSSVGIEWKRNRLNIGNERH
ncbi:YqjF family protein [Flavobacterium degerlachei]|jgi:hypothetical protein|uniref:DUF2071 domain-containing protein n=1 Tax=Flavobacterium degerlachei TaxID=229203 RepID=A0A1H2Q0T9_9FLAO|nr:DUF2071 domain-containing protein [Flavobacterium degerlachei]SDW00468.1 hypothetical protein SAMN05444338_10144 [Flavobacterium degerlachei]